MGFKHQAKVYRLVFDDPELEGLEVRARSLSIAEARDDDRKVLDSFADALVSWNLEDENGQPLPATLETLETYPDVDFMNLIMDTWMTAVAGVDEELGKDSSSGEQSPEASLPMEPLSPSLAS